MPRRSKVELSEDTLHELENQFYSFLDSLSHEDTKKFFAEFLTLEEKMMMYKRLALYWMLFEGYSLASIQRSLGVTHDTTRLYNKRKNQMSEEFKNILHRIGRTTEAAKSHEQISQVSPKPEAPVTEMPKEEVTPEAVFTAAPQEEKMESMNTDEFIPSVEKHENENNQPQEQEAQDASSETQEAETHPFEDVTVTEEVAIEETVEFREEPQSDMQPQQEQFQHEQQQPNEPETPFISAEQQQNQDNNEEAEENKQEEKKKKGLGRFFGF